MRSLQLAAAAVAFFPLLLAPARAARAATVDARALGGCTVVPAGTRGPAARLAPCPEPTAALAAEGHKIFVGKGNCSTCHGMDAKGTPLAPNLLQHKWLNIDGSYAAIAGLVSTGVPHPKEHPAPMPAMGGAQLSQSEICQVAAYVYLLSHKS